MITLKEFISYLREDCRLHIFDCGLAFDYWWDDPNNDDPIVYFGDYREVPDNLLSRRISCIGPSDEYVNCIHIELKKEG